MVAGDVPELHWRRTTLDGRTAVFGEAGEGTPVVFVHGWGLSARAYARALPHLAGSGARVIAPALPGFGRSDALDGAYTFERLADWLDDLLDHVGVDEPAALVGHSFGGAVATALAHRHPARVRALVLVNAIGGSVWKPGRRGERSLAERPLWDWGLRLPGELRRHDYRRILPVIVRDAVGNALTNPSALLRAADLARRADLREELTAVAARGVPVTVLWGAEDDVVPEATSLALCEAAGSPGDVIPEAGHGWLLADPEGFGDVVTNSLAVQRTAGDLAPTGTRTPVSPRRAPRGPARSSGGGDRPGR